MTLFESNKLICEYVGWSFKEHEDSVGFYLDNSIQYVLSKNEFKSILTSEHGFAYHCNLNKLKIVIDRFLNIPIETFNYNAKAMGEFRSVRASLANIPISKSIEDFYNELVSAITWYNQNKPA